MPLRPGPAKPDGLFFFFGGGVLVLLFSLFGVVSFFLRFFFRFIRFFSVSAQNHHLFYLVLDGCFEYVEVPVGNYVF